MSTAKALFWKDCRVNRAVLIFAVMMLIGPWLGGFIFKLYADWRTVGEATQPGTWPDVAWSCSMTCLALSLLVVAFLGANAVACERADRSAEFLFYLPPSRLQIITVKAALAIGTGLLFWLVNVGLYYGLVAGLWGQGDAFDERGMAMLAATAVSVFGAAWLASTLLSKQTFAAELAFAAPVTIGSVIVALNKLYDLPQEQLRTVYMVLCLFVGIGCFAAGFIYFLRRVEP
jgi:ABC-type transport system involved in multi-copper enzyme maturation permease subunit